VRAYLFHLDAAGVAAEAVVKSITNTFPPRSTSHVGSYD